MCASAAVVCAHSHFMKRACDRVSRGVLLRLARGAGVHVDARGVTHARRRFSDLWTCVEDAKKHGLSERPREQQADPPALLH